jgi:peptide/nickel transport system permease protein
MSVAAPRPASLPPRPAGVLAGLIRKRSAFAGLVFLVFLYALLPFVEVIAPYDPETRNNDRILMPPVQVHLFHDGGIAWPYVHPVRGELDTETFQRRYVADTTRRLPVRFLCDGEPYHFLGLVQTRFRLACPPTGGTLHLLGTDRLGRDMLSRILHGARVSLTIGLIGVAISFVLGCLLGGLAGYAGGWTDALVLRLIEILRAIPELPLWMALAAALPANWSAMSVYFGITIILGLLDWPGLARAVRAKIMSLREEDYVVAAELLGASRVRVLFLHMLPNFSGHLIVALTLAVPAMILGETALSFLGLGLRPPVVSWGVLLNDAQNMSAIELYPWLLAPLLPVILVVLAFNVVGDGLRDVADPYRR